KIHHPNIVELYNVIETDKYIGIILQCATGGELFDYILAHRYLKEKDASRLFAQLMSGVHYMHQKRIVHRDLKLENLLLDKNRNVLITDFGFANQYTSAVDDLMSTSCGSPCYAAPELVMNQGVYVGPAVDIWSCGVILFAMLCGYLPYDDDPANPDSHNINLLYKYILNTPLIFPDYISKEACDLLRRMLVPDPEKRCTMETIMEHPWLSPHRDLFDFTIEEEEEEMVVPDQTTINETTTTTTTTTTREIIITDQTVPVPLEKDSHLDQKAPATPPKDELSYIVKQETRPKSTLSTSTEKVFHFLSGQNNTPGHTEKRTRHMSLADESHSILQAKFLSSTQRCSTNSPLPSPSASTPHKKTNRSGGARKKTLSLLVNSMTDRRRPSENQMTPSVSETTESKEKHRSAGKKFMDWFKKKPLDSSKSDPKLRTHHGAVDQEALTSRAPTQVFVEVKDILTSMGLEFKRDGGEYKLKCVRPRRVGQPQPNPNLRMLLRRPSNAQTDQIIYGEPSVDPGDEVRFSIELCKIKNLPGLYIVDMRRMRGNVWAYKYLYRTLMDALQLKQDDYLNRQHILAESTVEEEEEEEEEIYNNKTSSTLIMDSKELTA
ncbi:hypothetical protein CU098_005233, partial [Rhizopus stolonifer]